MNTELKMSFETVGSSSYVAVTCLPKAEVVNYELEMILSNDIKNFLGVSKQMLDGEQVLYYNITSRIPLKQILDKRKLNRKELFRLIDGAVFAIREAAEYRLPASGIILEPEYIYVNPATCSPAFMYMPLKKTDGGGLKEMLSELVFHDKIEMSKDNFIQVLLMELNRQPFSMDELQKSLKPYQNEGDVQPTNLISHIPVEPLSSATFQPVNSQQANQNLVKQPPISSMSGNKEAEKETVNKRKTEKREVAQKEKMVPENAKKKFILFQALVMVLTTASVSFGLFTDETGRIVLKYILVFVIILVLVEVILYREVYINGKEPKEKREKKESGVNKDIRKQKTVRPESPRPVLPKPISPQEEPAGLMNAKPTDVNPSGQRAVLSDHPVYPPHRANPVYKNQDILQYSSYGGAEEELITDTELAEDEIPAYLEYYESGRLDRIPLDSINGIVIGRLAQQVDYVVKSPRVGKMHAKFLCQNGQYYVIDINSKNGTYINGGGMRIDSNKPYQLHDKDRIMLADCEFTIRCT